MAGANVHEITDANFESEVLNSDIPVMVDFWAPWCGPCLMLGPTVDQIADEHVGEVKVCKVNIDDNPETPSKYGIRGVPTILFFKDGQMKNQVVGAVAKQHLEQVLSKL